MIAAANFGMQLLDKRSRCPFTPSNKREHPAALVADGKNIFLFGLQIATDACPLNNYAPWS